MRTVRDDEGTEYLLLSRSDDTSRVRNPVTGAVCYVRTDRLEPVDESSLEIAARGVSEPVRRLLTAVHDDRALGLLLEVADRGPTRVRTLLSATEYCESDLHGTLAMLTAADLLVEETVAGERGYRVTGTCEDALDVVRRMEYAGADDRDEGAEG